MAKHVILDPVVTIASTPIPSGYIRAINLDYDAETPEMTASGDMGKTRLGGLLDMKFNMELNQDFDDGLIDDILFAIIRVPTAIKVQPQAGTIGANCPSFEGTFILSKYPIIGGKIGDVATTKPEFAGSGVLTRNVTPA